MLLERSALPRERPGETLHPGVEAPLRELGVLDEVLRLGLPRHRGVWVSWGEEPRFDAYGSDDSGPWSGFQALRGSFDALLAARAQELGAVLCERCRAVAPVLRDGRVAGVETAAGVLRARYVIDGAGAGHWLARRLGVALDRRSPSLIARFGYLTGSLPCARRGAGDRGERSGVDVDGARRRRRLHVDAAGAGRRRRRSRRAARPARRL